MSNRSHMTFGQECVAFYMAIGMATTQWAHVESGLFNLSAWSFGKTGSKAIGPSFYAIENFRTKLAFTDQAFQTVPRYGAFAQEWIALREQIVSLSKRRNKIAHGNVRIFVGATAGHRYAIVPIRTVETKIKSKKIAPPRGSLCVKEIDLASRQFGKASNNLLGLVARLNGHKDPFAEHAQQELQHQTLAQLTSQIESMFQQPF